MKGNCGTINTNTMNQAAAKHTLGGFVMMRRLYMQGSIAEGNSHAKRDQME